jgi:D-ribose pyranase
MRRDGILNQAILNLTGGLGHTDRIVVCDAGLPIPSEVERIDLAVVKGLPGFVDVLRPLLAEIVIEKVVLAKEIQKANPNVLAQIRELVGAAPIEFVSHEEFKRQTRSCRGIIRTGEATPFANVILQSGVNFS